MEELEMLYQEMGISPAVYARGEKSTLLSAGWPVSKTAFSEEWGPEE